jgi:hypothetical protein
MSILPAAALPSPSKDFSDDNFRDLGVAERIWMEPVPE